MDLSVSLRTIAVRAKLSEEVVWGVSLQQAQAALLPQNCSLSELVFFLNDSGNLPKFPDMEVGSSRGGGGTILVYELTGKSLPSR